MNSRRVVLVTGAAGGIGQAVVSKFLSLEYCVVAAVHRVDDIYEFRHRFSNPTDDALHVVAYDVNDSAATTQTIYAATKRVGGLDIAVNNAGILRDKMLGMLDDDTLTAVVNTNAVSLIRHMRDESKIMLRFGRGGSIVNVASVVGIDGNQGQVAYSASKAAVVGATKSAAKDLALLGIRVNAVAPGLIDTPMLRSVDPTKVAAMAARIPLQRLGTPDDVADAIDFLSSTRASYITGQVVRIDGGFTV